MHVEVITPESKIFNGEAKGVKVPGITGYFEILKDHAPLISALGKGELRIATANNADIYDITGGFVEVLNNHVIVLIESAKKQSGSN